MRTVEKVWSLQDHLCRDCGGRILRCEKGAGPSPGGNPLWKCADCGRATTSMQASALCWCGFSMRQNLGDTAYVCQPFSILEQHPALEEAFRACGCDPKRGEVGIMLERDFRRLAR